MSPVLSSSSKTIDIPIHQLFHQFDLNTDNILTRKQLSIFLNNIFIKMNINKSVTEEDVNNFLLDYSINHNRNELTKNDFQGIRMLRFMINVQKVVEENKGYGNNFFNSNYQINQITQGSQVIPQGSQVIPQGSQVRSQGSQVRPQGSQVRPHIITRLQQQQPTQAHFIRSIKQVQSMNTIQLNKTINITKQQPINPKLIFQPSSIKYTIPSSKFSFFSSSSPATYKITLPISMLFDCFNPSQSGSLSLVQLQKVLTLIFQDFGLTHSPNSNDVRNFLKEFDINKDKQIRMDDFKDKNVLVFQFYQETKKKINGENQVKLNNVNTDKFY